MEWSLFINGNECIVSRDVTDGELSVIADAIIEEVYGDYGVFRKVDYVNLVELFRYIAEFEYEILDGDRDGDRYTSEFDEWFMELWVDERELFNYLAELPATREYVWNMDYNFKGQPETKLFEIAHKIFFSTYFGYRDLSYLNRYIESVGGFTDHEIREIRSHMDGFMEVNGYDAVDAREEWSVTKEEYEDMLAEFKLKI